MCKVENAVRRARSCVCVCVCGVECVRRCVYGERSVRSKVCARSKTETEVRVCLYALVSC